MSRSTQKRSLFKIHQGVGGQIFFTYLFLSIVGILAVVIAWSGLRALEKSQRSLVEESTPLVISAYRLSASVNNVVDLLSQESVIYSVEDRAQLNERLDRAIRVNNQEISVIKQFQRGGDIAKMSEEIVSDLHESVSTFRELIGIRIETRETAAQQLSEVSELVSRFFSLIEPEVVRAKLGQLRYGPSHERAIVSLSQFEDSLEDVLAEFPFVSSQDRLLSLRGRFMQDVRQMTDFLVKLEDRSLQSTLASLHGQIVSQLDESTGLFASKLQTFAVDRRVEAAQALNAELEEELMQSISDMVADADTLIKEDFAAATRDRTWTQQVLILFDIIFITLPMVILYLYIKPRLIDRLDTLAGNTRAIASGDLDTKIETSGSDEISALGEALEQFRGDLLQKRESEAQLAESEQRFRLVGELATDGYWDWDLKTNEEYLSPSFKKLFGYEDHEMENHVSSWQKIIHPDDLKAAFAAYEGHVERGEPFSLPVRYYHKNGGIVWVICRGVALKDENGEYYRMIGTHTNITGLKETEERLEQSNRELEQFAFIASHDLQEPLRTVTGYVQLIERKYEGLFDADGKEFLGFITHGTQRMRDLINDLLGYSRVGHGELLRESISLKIIVEQVLESYGSLIKRKGARIEFPNGDLPTVQADRFHMRQLLHNLIGNALKFSRAEEPPLVKISWETTVSEGRRKEYKISIEDNGIGIEDDYFEKIFLIFQRLNDRQNYEGTGIGLALCKRIVQRHEGQLFVESVLGQGSTFHFTLPYRK